MGDCCVWLKEILKGENENARKFRKVVTAVTFGYFIFLLLLLFLMGWWGERHWLLSILLFVPATLWIVPFLLLTPLHLIFRPALCGITFMAAFVVNFVYLDFSWSFGASKTQTGLVVVTGNIGQREFQTLGAFLENEKPDIIALQDARYMGRKLKAQHPEHFVTTLGEFVLASRFPIRDAGLISQLSYRGHPIGAWYEVIYQGQPIVIYNIHMPTPRPEFLKLNGRGLFKEAIRGGGIYSPTNRTSYIDFIETKIRLSRGLIEILQNEKRPFLVVGDFNMPANGYIFDLFGSKFTDAFGSKGRGHGFTFPSTSKNPLSFFGPWLRLDYLFAGKNWQPNFCRVEPRQPGQHRAVAAQFELQDAK